MERAADDLVASCVRAFEEHADARRSPAMSAYMRDQFAFLGIPAPRRQTLGRELLAGRAPLSQAQLASAARKCWALAEREYQYFACDLLRREVKRCDERFLAELRWLITHKSWWDTVDALSASVGVLVATHPRLVTTMDAWIDDENFWLARVALIHQLSYKEHTDTARLFDYCARRATDTEFFIRKAIGWALRQYAKTDRRAVERFVKAHPELSPLSQREALLVRRAKLS